MTINKTVIVLDIIYDRVFIVAADTGYAHVRYVPIYMIII